MSLQNSGCRDLPNSLVSYKNYFFLILPFFVLFHLPRMPHATRHINHQGMAPYPFYLSPFLPKCQKTDGLDCDYCIENTFAYQICHHWVFSLDKYSSFCILSPLRILNQLYIRPAVLFEKDFSHDMLEIEYNLHFKIIECLELWPPTLPPPPPTISYECIA